jgi:hypothetical protein
VWVLVSQVGLFDVGNDMNFSHDDEYQETVYKFLHIQRARSTGLVPHGVSFIFT